MHKFRWWLVSFVVVFTAVFFGLSFGYSVPILTYHDFGPVNAGTSSSLLISPERFDEQMAFLKKYRYNVITLDELVSGLKAGQRFPHHTVVLTIDDGNQSNYTYAYPVLKKYGLPAILFLVTDRVDLNPDYLTWAQVREMSAHGISFGAHTKNHHVLPMVTHPGVLWDEIAGSKRDIEAHTGSRVEHFAYPVGAFTPGIKDMVLAAGYRSAVTTNRGRDLSNTRDMYELHRISVRHKDKGWGWRLKLSGYYNIFKRPKAAWSPTPQEKGMY